LKSIDAAEQIRRLRRNLRSYRLTGLGVSAGDVLPSQVAQRSVAISGCDRILRLVSPGRRRSPCIAAGS